MAEEAAVPVHDAALPAGGGEVLGRALDQAQAGVRDDQLDAGEPTLLQVGEEARPPDLVLLGTLADAQDLAEALGRDAVRQ